jgi:hypothetical protein
MAIFIMVYHSGVVINNEIGSYKLVGIKKATFLLNKPLTLANVVRLMCERLGWMDDGCEIRFEGRIDIKSSNGPQMKMMSPICDEKEWPTYVGVVMKSEIRGIELVARMVIQNDVGDESSRLPTLPKAIDEQHVECGIVLTQPLQETQDAEEPPFVASNEIVLNVEPVYGSVGVGDGVADTGFILGVNPQLVDTRFVVDVDPSSIDQNFMLEYEAIFGDERVEDSIDNRSVPELSNMDKALLQ